MVKEIVKPQKEFTEINFYPLDVIDVTPPDIKIHQNIDSNFRISQIISYNEYLSQEISNRENAIKSFKYVEYICFLIEMIFACMDITLGIISIFFKHYNSTISIVCIVLTGLGTFLRNMTKKHMKKVEKHQALFFLTKSKLTIVQEKYSIAIRDGNISHDEYVKIIDEFEKYQKLRKEILSKFKDS